MAFQAGAVVASLTLDRSKFTAAVKGVQKQTKAMGGWVKQNSAQFKRMGLAITAMGTAALFTFKKMIDKYVEVGDMVDKMSKRTAFAAETISELAYAADISGADITMLEKAVKKMSKTIVDAGYGLETYLRVFRSLGLEVEDLMALSPEEQFMKIGAAIADMEDDTLRTAAAVDVFGRSGTMLLPMFKEGAEGIAKLREEAHRLGIVFDEEAAAKAAKLKDAQTALSKALQGVGFAIAEEFVPILTSMAEHFTDVFVNVRGNTKSFVTGILGFFKILAQGVQGLMLAWTGFKGLVFKIAEYAGKVMKAQIDIMTAPLKLLAKIPGKLGEPARLMLEEVGKLTGALTIITDGYNKSADEQAEKMATIIERYEALVMALNKVGTGFDNMKKKSVETSETIVATVLPATEQAGDALMGLGERHEELITTWGKEEKDWSKEETIAMDALMAAYYGGLEGMISYFEQLAVAALLKWVMTTVPFPFNLIAAPIAMATAKGLFKTIRGMASFEEGGYVPEETIAHLHPGEYVVPAKDVERGGVGARVNIMFAPVFNLPTTDPITMRDIVRLQIAPEMLEMFRSKILLDEFQKAMGV